MPVIPELRRLRQEDHECKASLGYIVRLCLSKREREREREREVESGNHDDGFSPNSLNQRMWRSGWLK
jgi:hypothetical protein